MSTPDQVFTPGFEPKTVADAKAHAAHLKLHDALAASAPQAPPELGRKLDAGKARFDLIPQVALHGLASCLAYGAAKYSDDNWSKVPAAPRRYYAALLRHVEAWRAGEQRDAESGLHHLDHALACLAFLRALDVGQVGTTPGAPEFRP